MAGTHVSRDLGNQIFTVICLHKTTGESVIAAVEADTWAGALALATEGRRGDLIFVAIFDGEVEIAGTVENLANDPLASTGISPGPKEAYTIVGMDFPAEAAQCVVIRDHHWVLAADRAIKKYGPPGYRFAVAIRGLHFDVDESRALATGEPIDVADQLVARHEDFLDFFDPPERARA